MTPAERPAFELATALRGDHELLRIATADRGHDATALGELLDQRRWQIGCSNGHKNHVIRSIFRGSEGIASVEDCDVVDAQFR